MRRFPSVLALAGLLSSHCAPASGTSEATIVPAQPPSSSSVTTAVPVASAGAGVDYLILAPRAFAEELQPLLDLRKSQGHRVAIKFVEDIYAQRSNGAASAQALRDEITALAGTSDSPALRFVVLAGDPDAAPARVPSFFAVNGDWSSGFGEDPKHRTDYDFTLAVKNGSLAVGRLPARTEAELTTMVSKLLRYESPAASGAWQRRVLVFGGPADFGPVADGLLEAQATNMLDQLLPYDYDVGVVFAKSDSPYVYRYDQLGAKIISEMNEGSLLSVYAGHGLPESFDRARYRGERYPIGNARDLQGLAIEHGSPIFVALTCLNGDYGMPSGARSIAETMMIHPKGPVAVFASSDISHPYANVLYAQALLDSFILQRAPTLGEGIGAAKRSMLERSIPFASLLVPGDHAAIKREHLTLYNLFGDPAMTVRRPLPANVQCTESAVTPGKKLHLAISSEDLQDGTIDVTVETERSALKTGMVAPAEIEAMPIEKAFETMAKNYEIATDKVLSKATGKLASGKAEVDVIAPSAKGRYFAKVLVHGDKNVASGHFEFQVQ